MRFSRCAFTWPLVATVASVFINLQLAAVAMAAPPISVQVSPSAHRLADVVGGELEVRIVVSNQSSASMDNGLLVLPSPSGGAIVRTSRRGTSDAGGLAWPVGTLEAGDRFEVDVVVEVAGVGEVLPAPEVHASYGGSPVWLRGRPVVLSGDDLPAEYLVATPDADPTDPPIAHRSAVLGGAREIFRFVQRQVHHQPYRGSLHGARGTLYGLAGSSADRSNLLVALLRAAGIPAGYRRGTLDDATLDRLETGLFAPEAATDRARRRWTAEDLRAAPDLALALIPYDDLQGLGVSRSEQLTAVAALDDVDLLARVYASGRLDPEEREAVRDHVWVEAWIDGEWTAMDPSFWDTDPGDSPAGSTTGDPDVEIEPELRHRVIVRVFHETTDPAFGAGKLDVHPASLTVERGAGDLVGRTLKLHTVIDRVTTAGMIFWNQSITYAPVLELEDQERLGEVETVEGDVFEEFASNFGGVVGDVYGTGIFVEVELLAPGQQPGEGQTTTRALADRIGFAARNGAPLSTHIDFTEPMMDPLDVTVMLIGASHMPPRLVRGSQLILRALALKAEEVASAMEDMPDDGELEPENVEVARDVTAQLLNTNVLLHSAHMGDRANKLAQGAQVRAYNTAPRIVFGGSKMMPNGRPSVSIDLARERAEALIAPGAYRRNGDAFRMAYGWAATELEGDVLAIGGLAGTTSTARVFAKAYDQGIGFLLLGGTEAATLELVQALNLSEDARSRILAALRHGRQVYTPTAEPNLDGRPVAAWLEVEPDGNLIGRLDDGTGGAAIEYGLILTSMVCAEAVPCPSPLGFIANLSAMLGHLWGLVTSSYAAASTCAGGARSVCDKLVTALPGVIDQVMDDALNEIVTDENDFFDTSSCNVHTEVVTGVADAINYGTRIAIEIPGAEFADPIGFIDVAIEGYCKFAAAFKKASDAVTAAVRDPLTSPLDSGVMSPNVGDSREQSVTQTLVDVPASLTQAVVTGDLQVQHVRFDGGQVLRWSAAPQTVPTRRLEASSAEVRDQDGGLVGSGVTASWHSVGFPVSIAGYDQATLTGDGSLDVYADALSTVAGVGTWGDPLVSEGSGYSMHVAGADLAVALDSSVPDPLPRPSGTLSVDGDVVEQVGSFDLGAAAVELQGATAGPLGADQVELDLSDAAIRLTGATGTLTVGANVVSDLDGLGLASTTGTVTIRTGTPGGTELSLDLVGAERARLDLVPGAMSGYGPFEFEATLESSLAGAFTLWAYVPDGWEASWEETHLRVVPSVGARAGNYEVGVLAVGPAGLAVAQRMGVELVVPTEPAVELRLVDDPRHTDDIAGARFPARLLQVRHTGQGPGSYTLTASSSEPALGVELARASVEVNPGETRLIGVDVRPEGGRPWPAPGTPYLLSFAASGAAEAEITLSEEVPSLATVTLSVSPDELFVAPGTRAVAEVTVTATGNAPVLPALLVDAATDVDTQLAGFSGALMPGETRALSLEMSVLASASGTLPAARSVVVHTVATELDQERGLAPVAARLRLMVSPEGTQQLLEELLVAVDEGDDALTGPMSDLLFESLTAHGGVCSDKTVTAVESALREMASVVLARGDDALAAELTGQADRVASEGCAALDSLDSLFGDLDLHDVGAAPNLKLSLTGPTRVENGVPVDLVVTIVNDGRRDAGAFDVVLRRRQGDIREVMHTAAVGELAVGQSTTVEVTWDTASTLGTSILSARADTAQVIRESEEGDNRADLVVEVLPDSLAPAGNHAPVFSSVPPTEAGVRQPTTYEVSANDPDGDQVFLSAPITPPGLRFDPSTGTLDGAPSRLGTHPVLILASDRYGAVTAQEFALVVGVDAVVNEPPQITSRPVRRAVVGQVWSYALEGFDPEQTALTWQLGAAPAGLTLDTSGSPTLSWTPEASDEGVHWVAVTVTDSGGATATQPFPVTVRAAALGPDLLVSRIDRSSMRVDGMGMRSGDIQVFVANVGDTDSAATEVAVYEEEDQDWVYSGGDELLGRAVIPPLGPGARTSVTVPALGEALFGDNVLFVVIDPDDVVTEIDEDNNGRFSGQLNAAPVGTFVGYRPVGGTLTLVAGPRGGSFQVIDPVTDAAVDGGELSPWGVVDPSLEIDDGNGGSFALDHFVVEADRGIAPYLVYEIFEPDFGADLFHPSVDGQKVGRDFVLYVPTLTPNNRLVVAAVQPSQVTVTRPDGTEVDSVDLIPGQAWEPAGLVGRTVYHLESTGDVVVQSAAVTGCSVVPPSDSVEASYGDVGRDFLFSIRSRGTGGGAVAVMAYEDATYVLTTSDLTVLATGSLAAGEVAFHADLGEHMGLRLSATGAVSVLAGDISRPGAATLDLMGEDITQIVGRSGLELVVHSQAQDVGDSSVLAGPSGSVVRVDGVPVTLARFERLALSDGAVYRLDASSPVMVQAMGGGDRAFDMGDSLRPFPSAARKPRLSLWNVHFDTGSCAQSVRARGRLGNGGTGSTAAGTQIDLVESALDGDFIVATHRLDGALRPGDYADFELGGATLSLASGRSYMLRVSSSDGEVLTWSGAGSSLAAVPISAACVNSAPTFTSVPPSSYPGDAVLIYEALAVDAEGDPITYGLEFGPPGAIIDSMTGQMTWRPTGPARSARFALSASDPAGATSLQSFDLSVSQVGPCAVDNDGDGVCAERDCNDSDPVVNPGQTEVLGDGVDNDCNVGTPDVLAGGQALLALTTDRAVYRPGELVSVRTELTNLSTELALAGAVVDLVVSCDVGEEVALPASEIPSVGPLGLGRTATAWLIGATHQGACVVTGTLMAGESSMATATAEFEVRPGLVGTLSATPPEVARGEPVTLDWTLDNAAALDVDTTVTVGIASLPPFHESEVTASAGTQTEGTATVETARLPPALYSVDLLTDGVRVASAAFAVRSDARIEAPYLPTLPMEAPLAELGAAVSPVVFRPLGPRPGAINPGAWLRGAWTDGRVELEVEVSDETADGGDAVEVGLASDEEQVVVALRWERATGVVVSVGDDTAAPTFAETPGGYRLRFSFSEDVVGRLLEGDTRRLRIAVRDGDAGPETRDAWVWASHLGAANEVDTFGELVLVGHEPGPTPDAGPDASEPPDAGLDADVGPGDVGPQGVGGGADDGCGCVVASPTAPATPVGLLALLPLTLLVLRRRRRLFGVFAAAVLLLAGGGCSDHAGSGPVFVAEDAGNNDEDAGGGSDAERADVSTEQDAEAETDASAHRDAAVFDFAEEGAPFGAACDSDEGCASGICLSNGEVSVCSALCDAYPCPEGWSCERFPGGGRVCVSGTVCVDADGDGYGRGRGCDGSDCDEQNAEVHEGAAEVCNGLDDDCDGEVDEGVANACGGCGDVAAEVCNGLDDDCDGEIDEGVANACGRCGEVAVEVCNGLDDDCNGSVDDGVCAGCAEDDTAPCYGGPDGTQGVGSCVGGVQTCRGGVLSICEGQVLPGEDVCNGLDDDCDGEVDEGTLNVCGECGPEPLEVCNGEDDDCDGEIDEGALSRCGGCEPCSEALIFPAELGWADPVIAPAPDGGVTLGAGQVSRHFIWVPNSDEGSVSHWDTRTGREVARYWIGTDPSRTAIDLDGNVWVGHRGDGLASHIFSNHADCIDRNGDGVIETSSDLNGDGRITGLEMVGSADDPFADECLHCQVRVGQPTDLIRGVGVDADNYAWLGTWNSHELYKVDPKTCNIEQVVPTTNLSGGNPTPVYGLVIDGDGHLFTSSFSTDCIQMVDTRTGTTLEQICNAGTKYGIALDGLGRIWYGDYGSSLVMLDPNSGDWSVYTEPTGTLRTTTGVVAALDGKIWVAGYDSHHVARFDPETLQWDLFSTVDDLPPGVAPLRAPRGVTIDSDGNVWAICRTGSGLMKFAPDGQVLASYAIVGAMDPTRGTGPYSYSDNTGFNLLNFTATEGGWRYVFDAGAAVQFVRLTYSRYLPAGSTVSVKVRAGVDRAALDAATWSADFDSDDIDLRPLAPSAAQLLEMEFRLTSSDPTRRPVLRDIQVFFEAPDCRDPANPCPHGQSCDVNTGACLIVPLECQMDDGCPPSSYCDATGACRSGCRLDPDSCGIGFACDAADRRCVESLSDCARDDQCAEGSYCEAGFCTVGCRDVPDSCPSGFVCDVADRTCAAQPPECTTDDPCLAEQYCDLASGTCLTGCRVGAASCNVTEVGLDGMLRSWYMLGPFPRAGGDVDTSYLAEPEDETTLVYGQVVEPGLVVGLLESTAPSGYVDVGAYYGGLSEAVAYAMTVVNVDAAATLDLGIGTDDNAKIWVGGPTGPMTLVYTHVGPRGSVPDSDTVQISLEAGENRILVKLINFCCGWGFHLGLREAGTPYSDATIQLSARACDASSRRCELLAPDCDVSAISEEVCNGVDDDCDGLVDEEAPAAGASCSVGDAAVGETVCIGGGLLCRAEPSADPAVPVSLEGVLTDVLLPAGLYEVPSDVSVEGRLVLEEGAVITTPDSAVHTLSSATEARLTATGATFEGLDFVLGRSNAIDLRDSLLIGVAGGQTRMRADWTSDVRLLESTLRDITLVTGDSTTAVLERVHFESTDTRARWSAELRGDTYIDQSVFEGRNLVPRIQSGIHVIHPAVVDVRDTAFRRFVTGILFESSGGTSSLTGSEVADSDVGVDVRGWAFPSLQDNTFVGTDVGHVMLAVRVDNIRNGGGIDVTGSEFYLDPTDSAFWLDLDVFQAMSPSTIAGSTFVSEPLHRYLLASAAEGGQIDVRLLDGATHYDVEDNLLFQQGVIASFADDLRLVNGRPDATYRLEVANTSELTSLGATLENLRFVVGASASLNLDSALMTFESPVRRVAVYTRGTTIIADSVISSLDPVVGATRVHWGLEAVGTADLTVSGTTFSDLEYGIVQRDNVTSSLAAVVFDQCRTGIYLEEWSVADPVSACSFFDQDSELVSLGLDLRFNRGGRAVVTGASFAIGPEDVPVQVDPDAFQVASPTTFAGTTYANGERGQGFRLRGASDGGDVQIDGLGAETTLNVYETIELRNSSTVTIGGGIVLAGDPNAGRVVVVRDNAVLNTDSGAVFRDLTLQANGDGSLAIDGASFESSNTRGRNFVEVYGAAQITASSFIGTDRRQGGVAVRGGGVATVEGGSFSNLDWGVYSLRDGDATVTGASFLNDNRGLYVQFTGSLATTGLTFTNGDPDPAMIGIETYNPETGMFLSATDNVFDYGPSNVAYRLDLKAFMADRTLSFSGSAFVSEQQARDYQVWGTVSEGTTVVAHLEPIQTGFEAIGNLTFNGSATGSMADGTVLRSAPSNYRVVDVRNTAVVDVGAATISNMMLAYRETTRGTVTGASFDNDLGGQRTLLAIGTPNLVSVSTCSFAAVGTAATNTWGVHVYTTDSAAAPSLDGNTFDDLNYGVYIANGPQPVLSANVFNGCANDVFWQ